MMIECILAQSKRGRCCEIHPWYPRDLTALGVWQKARHFTRLFWHPSLSREGLNMIRPTWKDFLIDSLGPAGGGLIISDISLVLLEFWWITYPIHVLFCKLIQIDWLDDFIFQCVNPLIKATCALTNNSTYHNINVKQKQKAKHLLLNTTHTTNKRRYEIQVSVHNSLLVFPVLTFPPPPPLYQSKV